MYGESPGGEVIDNSGDRGAHAGGVGGRERCQAEAADGSVAGVQAAGRGQLAELTAAGVAEQDDPPGGPQDPQVVVEGRRTLRLEDHVDAARNGVADAADDLETRFPGLLQAVTAEGQCM